MIYRILLFLYIFIWLILHIVARKDTFGPHWLIFISDLSYALLMVSTGSIALLCFVYMIVYYKKKHILLKFIPRKDFPVVRIYKQDNIPWYVKIIWMLYIISKSVSFLVFLGYWVLIFPECGKNNSSSSGGSNNTTDANTSFASGDAMMATTESTGSDCIDVYTIQIHGVNFFLVVLDIFLSRVPYQFLHFFYPVIFSFTYIIFSIIYWAAGGKNHNGRPYIYSSLNYPSASAFGYAIALIIAPIVTYLILFLLTWLRDVIYKCCSCCFRDIKELPYRDDIINTKELDNGVADSNGDHMTAV